MWQNSGRAARVWILRQQISLRSLNSTDWQQLAAVRCLPELMSLRTCPQEQKHRVSLPQNFPVNSLEQRAAVARSLFEPAEHRPAKRETDSESSRRLPALGFQAKRLGSRLATTQHREAMPKC